MEMMKEQGSDMCGLKIGQDKNDQKPDPSMFTTTIKKPNRIPQVEIERLFPPVYI